jgi:hypothetical protein
MPQKLDLGTRRVGDFSIEVDNRRGRQPLNVAFSGRSDDGLVRATFAPPQVAVAPGAVGQTRMSVSSPYPRAGQVGVRRLEIVASDGTQSLTASAELSQTGPDRRRPTSRWLVVIGALLVAVGALLPWFAAEETTVVPFTWIKSLSGDFVLPMDQAIAPSTIEAVLRITLLALALAMLFGLAGRAGGLTRKSALLVVLLTAGYLVALAAAPGFRSEIDLSDSWFGLPIIWAGAVLGYIGGILARPRE